MSFWKTATDTLLMDKLDFFLFQLIGDYFHKQNPSEKFERLMLYKQNCSRTWIFNIAESRVRFTSLFLVHLCPLHKRVKIVQVPSNWTTFFYNICLGGVSWRGSRYSQNYRPPREQQIVGGKLERRDAGAHWELCIFCLWCVLGFISLNLLRLTLCSVLVRPRNDAHSFLLQFEKTMKNTL